VFDPSRLRVRASGSEQTRDGSVARSGPRLPHELKLQLKPEPPDASAGTYRLSSESKKNKMPLPVSSLSSKTGLITDYGKSG
jgi:hypothetical protein